jgi:hypothetical protein
MNGQKKLRSMNLYPVTSGKPAKVQTDLRPWQMSTITDIRLYLRGGWKPRRRTVISGTKNLYGVRRMAWFA